jgi:hypothetical protein
MLVRAMLAVMVVMMMIVTAMITVILRHGAFSGLDRRRAKKKRDPARH